MVVAGIDIGSATSKVAILDGDRLVAKSIVATGAESANSAQKAMDAAIADCPPLTMHDVKYVVATGYGRIIVPFADEEVTEISCHARGAHWLFPSARTILDMGGQDCKAIRCDSGGRLANFAMNDKCAAGTGRFLEVMARTMDLPLNRLGELSLAAEREVKISSTCTVFGKTEVLGLIRDGRDKRDILAGLHESIAHRVYTLLRRVAIERDFVMTGGIAKNVGVVAKVEQKLGLKALIPPEPQIVGALGAALFARDRVSSVGAHSSVSSLTPESDVR